MTALRARVPASSRSDDAGFTLVELLVVMVLLGVVGAVLTSSVVTGLQRSREAQERVYTLADLEQTAQNMGREIRAADPIMATPAPDDDTLRVTVLRDGGKRIITYDASSGQLQQTVALYPTPESATPTSTTTTVIVPELADIDVFDYFKSDRSSWTAADSLGELAQVDITLVGVTDAGQEIEVRTSIFVRNVQDGRT